MTDRRIEAHEVIALPVMDGPAIEGLPKDAGGFIPIDEHARVAGVADVYAAGDGTNFPIRAEPAPSRRTPRPPTSLAVSARRSQ